MTEPNNKTVKTYENCAGCEKKLPEDRKRVGWCKGCLPLQGDPVKKA